MTDVLKWYVYVPIPIFQIKFSISIYIVVSNFQIDIELLIMRRKT